MAGMDSLIQKLDPVRFPGMSSSMATVVGGVVGQPYGKPEVAEIAVGEKESFVWVRKDDDVGPTTSRAWTTFFTGADKRYGKFEASPRAGVDEAAWSEL